MSLSQQQQTQTRMDDPDVYRKRLAAMQELRDLSAKQNGGFELQLPQLCVVGDQSSGKSSVLTCVTGVQFPEKAGICTRAPIVVECRQQATEEYWIRDTDTGRWLQAKSPSDLQRQIGLAQAALLEKLEKENAGPANTMRPPHKYHTRGTKGRESLNSVTSGAGEIPPAATSLVSKTEISVKALGPNSLNVIIVDLPGLIASGPGVKETEELVKTYTAPEQTLILLVSEANLDDQRVKARDLARQVDPKGKRTLRLLTKFDCLANHDPATRADAERLLKSGERGFSTGESAAKRMRLGEGSSAPVEVSPAGGSGGELLPHALVCRTQLEGSDGVVRMEYSERAETDSLAGLPAGRCGVEALKRRLPSIFARLVDVNLGGLREAAQQKLATYRAELQQMGATERDANQLIMELQNVLQATTDPFKQTVSALFKDFAEQVAVTEKTITQEWVMGHFRPNSFEPPLFQGREAFQTCFRALVQLWRPLLEDYRKRVERHTRESLRPRDAEEESLPNEFLQFLDAEWDNHCDQKLVSAFQKRMQETCAREVEFGTVNHYMETKYAGELFLPEKLVQDFVDDISDVELKRASATKNVQDMRQMLKKKLSFLRNQWALEHAAKTLDEQQGQRLYATVKAAFHVERQTFVDLILKDTRDFLLSPRERWIAHDLLVNENIKQHAREDHATRQRRAQLKGLIASMNEAMVHLRACQ